MKRIVNIITISSFFLILVMFAVSMIFFQVRTSLKTEVKQNQSTKTAVQKYVSCNFPLRENLHSLYVNLMAFTGKAKYDDVYILNDRLVELGKKGNDDVIEKNVNQLNAFSKSTDKSVYLMLAPTAAGVYSTLMPSDVMGVNQKKIINDINLKMNKNINTIDSFYPLYSARDEYIYYRTDNMWTSFGAYFAYVEASKKMGLISQTMSNYDQEYACDNYYGRLYHDVPYNGIQPDRINLFRSKFQSTVTDVRFINKDDETESKSVYFRSAVKTNKKTDIFLQGDKYVQVDINTSVGNGKRLLILKGSYANTLAPFFTPHYDKITLVDPYKLKKQGEKLSEIVDMNEYDDILVMFDIYEFSSKDCFDILI